MAIARVKVQFVAGRRGWEEIYYLMGASMNPDDNLATVKIMLNARSGLLPNIGTEAAPEAYPYIGAAVITTVAGDGANPAPIKRGASHPFAFGPASFATNPNLAKAASTYGGQRAAKVSLYANGKRQRRSLLLRGIPAPGSATAETFKDFGDLNAPIATLPESGKFQKAMQAFLDVIGPTVDKTKPTGKVPSTSWGIRYTQWTTTDELIKKVDLDTASDNWRLWLDPAEVTFGLMSKIRIRNLRGGGLAGINGVTTVEEEGPDFIVINKRPCPGCYTGVLTSIGTIDVLPTGGIQPVAYAGISEAFFSGWTDRQTGGNPTSRQKAFSQRNCCP